jgi:hypothetical protein
VGSSLFSARVGHAPPFSGQSLRFPVVRRRSSVWVAPVSAHGLHAPPSGLSGPFLNCRQLIFGDFLLQCRVFFFSFVRSQSALVGFKFYENICWLIARSGLFSLESERYCKRYSIVFLVKFIFLLWQLFIKSDPSGLENRGACPLFSSCKPCAFHHINNRLLFPFKKKTL